MNAPPSPIDPNRLDVSLSGDKALVRILGWMLALTLLAFVGLGVYTATQAWRWRDGCIVVPPPGAGGCNACGGGGCPFCMPAQKGESPLEAMASYALTIESVQHALDQGDIGKASILLDSLPCQAGQWERDYLERQTERLVENVQLDRELGPVIRSKDDAIEVTRLGPGRWLVVETIDHVCSRVEMTHLGIEGGSGDPLASGWFTQWKRSPDGSRVVQIRENRVTVWDTASRRKLLETLAHAWDIHGVGFSRDGTRLFTIGDEHESEHLKVWQLVPADRVLKGDGVRPLELTFEVDDRALTMLSEDGIVRRWHPWSGQRKAAVTLVDFDARPGQTLLHAGGERVAAVGKDGTVRVWNALNGQLVQTFALEKRASRSGPMAFSANAERLAVAEGGKVRIWSLSTGEATHRHSEADSFRALAFIDSDDSILAQIEGSREVVTWSAWGLQDGPEIEERRGRPRRDGWKAECIVTRIGVNAVGTRLPWPVASDAFRTPEALREYLLSSDRQRLIAACAGGRLVVWDTATGVQVASFMTPITEPTSLAMGADGKCLAVAGHDGTIRLLDGRERK